MNLEIVIDSTALQAAIGRMRGPEVQKITRAALIKRAVEARRAAVREFVSHGIGKGVFGRNDKGAWKIITLSRAQVDDDSVTMTLRATGFAAMQEQGAVIRPHEIKAKRVKALAFAVPGGFGFGGDMGFARVVHHPGGVVHRHPALIPASQTILPGALEEIRRGIEALWGRAA